MATFVQRTFLLLIPALALAFTSRIRAEQPVTSDEKSRVIALIEETRTKLARATERERMTKAALDQAQTALQHAIASQDNDAEPVARNAVETAKNGLNKAGSARQKLEQTISMLQERLAILDGSSVEGRVRPGDVVSLFDRAAKEGWKPDQDAPAEPFPRAGRHNQGGEPFKPGDEALDAMCSQYFRETMAEFSKLPEFARLDVSQWTDPNCNANCLIERIQNSSSARGEWMEMSTEREGSVQEFANHGALVVGVAYNPKGPGHLAEVFPNASHTDLSHIDCSQDDNSNCGGGPLVRDGNEHDPTRQADGRFYASTWGAVKASKVFNADRPPKWYVWLPSVK